MIENEGKLPTKSVTRPRPHRSAFPFSPETISNCAKSLTVVWSDGLVLRDARVGDLVERGDFLVVPVPPAPDEGVGLDDGDAEREPAGDDDRETGGVPRDGLHEAEGCDDEDGAEDEDRLLELLVDGDGGVEHHGDPDAEDDTQEGVEVVQVRTAVEVADGAPGVERQHDEQDDLHDGGAVELELVHENLRG